MRRLHLVAVVALSSFFSIAEFSNSGEPKEVGSKKPADGSLLNASEIGRPVQQVQLDVVVVGINGINPKPLLRDWGVVDPLDSFVIDSSGRLQPGIEHSVWFSVLEPSGDVARGLLGLIDGLKCLSVARIVTKPSLVTVSNRLASFLDGGLQAVPVVGGIDRATGVQFEPFGTQLDFLPTVLDNGRIRLELSASITDLDYECGTAVGCTLVPGRRRSSAERNRSGAIGTNNCCRTVASGSLVYAAPAKMVASSEYSFWCPGPKHS